MELVTGHAGTDHISSADMAALYRGALVAEDVVLAEGQKLSCTMTNANTAEIGTGSCLLQAHHARVETAEQLEVRSGSVGFNRNDLVVVRYTLGTGNVQTVYLAIIEGTAVAGEAEDPSYTTGSIDGGSTLVEFPLWRIPISGVNVGTPERIMPCIDTLQDQIGSVDVDADGSLSTQVAALRDSVSQIDTDVAVMAAVCSRSTGTDGQHVTFNFAFRPEYARADVRATVLVIIGRQSAAPVVTAVTVKGDGSGVGTSSATVSNGKITVDAGAYAWAVSSAYFDPRYMTVS